MSEDYADLRATLEWGADLELTPLQRSALRKLCLKIAGVDQSTRLDAEVAKAEAAVPSWRLKEEAERRRAAEGQVAGLEKRIAELEQALKANNGCFAGARLARLLAGANNVLCFCGWAPDNNLMSPLRNVPQRPLCNVAQWLWGCLDTPLGRIGWDSSVCK